MGVSKHKKIQDISKSVKELMAQAKEKKIKAGQMILQTERKINFAKKSGIVCDSCEKILKAGQNRLDSAETMEDYDTAIDLIESADRSLKRLKLQYKKSNQLIVTINKKYSEIERQGIFIKNIHDQISKAQGALDNNNYGEAIKISDEILAGIENTVQVFMLATDLISKAEAMINVARNFEAETAGAEKFLNDAREQMEAQDYSQAYKLAQESIKISESAKDEQIQKFQEQAEGQLTELENEIFELKKFGADSGKAAFILKKIKANLKKNDFKAAFDFFGNCKAAAAESKGLHQGAIDKLNSSKQVLIDARESGANITKAKQNWINAETAMKQHDYESMESFLGTAVSFAERALDEHRKMMSDKDKAEDLLGTAKSRITEAKDSGIVVNAFVELLEKGEEALMDSNYEFAQKMGNQVIDQTKELQGLYAEAQESILKAENSITESKSLVDTADAERFLTKALESHDAGNYPEATKFAKMIIENIEYTKSVDIPQVKLNCEDVPEFKTGTWAKCTMELFNEGKVHAKDVRLTISEEVESRGFSAIQNLEAGERRSVELGLRTNEVGDVPINIQITYSNPINKEPFESKEVIWLKTERGEHAPEVEAKREKPVEEAPEPAGDVKVLSEVEFFQGFVRLKVGIRNEMNTVITDTKLALEYDDNSLRLDSIDPDYKRIGNRITFGNIQPYEKKTAAFYLDPLICTESHIDGSLMYKDIYGTFNTSAMKRRKAEVVCPIFYTTENINTAMLKRLIKDELTIHDSKIYDIPSGIDYVKAHEVCRDTVQGHDLKLVREFEEKDFDDPEIETWYYGQTKVKKHKVVIKSSSRRKTNTIELFVACGDKQVLTGFLAELGHNFSDKLKQLGIVKTDIMPTNNTSAREAISNSNTLLNIQIPDKTTISISKRGEEYEVSFKASEERGEASELSEFIKVSPDSRKDLISQINDLVSFLNIFTCTRGGVREDGSEVTPPPSQEDSDDFLRNPLIDNKIKNLISFGQLLYGMFLPAEIQKHLSNVHEPIILKTNDNEIPWELLHDNDDFLCLKMPIGRRLRTREIGRTNPVKPRDKISALFIANATGDLPAAEEEVDYIINHIGSDIDIEVMRKDAASAASVLSAMQSGDYDIIHYAGHAEFNPRAPDESALLCAGKNKIYATEIKRILGGKPFVFLNACGSGKEKICENGKNYSGSDTEGLASSFILGGSLAFIGSSWPIPDISAGILASEFYRSFIGGESVGEALRKGRVHLKSERENDINWMAFILYGDPTLKLAK
jgi:hypothetical protein